MTRQQLLLNYQVNGITFSNLTIYHRICSIRLFKWFEQVFYCASVAFPDFTRGHWNEVKGYKHAFASAEDEAERISKEATAKMKEEGAKQWAKIAKQERS